MEKITDILGLLTKENGIILILILLLFIDRIKIWFTLVENCYCKWKKLDKAQANKNLETYTMKTAKVHEILEVYRESSSCARVAYYVFHNGGTDIRGIPFLKYSCINEATAIGIRPRLRLDKDSHIATIAHLAKSFMCGIPVLIQTKDLKQTALRAYLQEHDIIKCALMPIYEDSLLSGFISFEWHNEKHIPENDEDISTQILQCAKMVELHNVKDINHFLSH